MAALRRIRGAGFDPDPDPDRDLDDSPLGPDSVYCRGEPVDPDGKPDGAGYEISGINFLASDGDFDEFDRQVKEATAFLEAHKGELARLRRQPGVESMTLDFGIARRDVAARFDYLPPSLICVAGELGIGIEISQYASGDDAEGDDVGKG